MRSLIPLLLLCCAPALAQPAGVDLSTLDASVRPQDDFFRYANGGWLARTEIPGDQSRYGAFNELRDEAELNVRRIVEDAAGGRFPDDPDAAKLAAFYRSAMDSARVEALGLAPLRPTLDSIEGVSDAEGLARAWGRSMRDLGGTPAYFYVSQDPKRADTYALSLTQSGLSLPDRSYYLEDRFAAQRDSFLVFVATMLELADTPDAQRVAQRVLDLETALARAQWTRVQNRDRNATYNKMALAELEAMAPNVRWRAMLAEAGVPAVDSLIVRQPSYVRSLDSLVAATPVTTWQQYLRLHALDDAAPHLPKAFADAEFAFYSRVLRGVEQPRPRWKRSLDVAEGAMGEAVGRLYVGRHFKPEAKARMDALIANLQRAFEQSIDELDWMTPETKREARAKLAAFTPKVGYPTKWEDYGALEADPGDLLGNVRRARAFNFRDMVSQLGQPVDREEWGMTPQTVNAYYSSTMNEIVFPAAILQPPFFNPDADDAVNYGGIGAVIGHEFSHGFDDQGRKSDGAGNLRDWWTDADAEEYTARARRVVEQYNAYEPVEGMTINGELTLGENIADLAGLALAYRAYQLSLNGQEAPVIDGLTGDQRFFLGWAQVWRTKHREEALRQLILTDPHSPGEYRTNGVVPHLDAFYTAFGVEPGDPMYLAPEDRVRIW